MFTEQLPEALAEDHQTEGPSPVVQEIGLVPEDRLEIVQKTRATTIIDLPETITETTEETLDLQDDTETATEDAHDLQKIVSTENDDQVPDHLLEETDPDRRLNEPFPTTDSIHSQDQQLNNSLEILHLMGLKISIRCYRISRFRWVIMVVFRLSLCQCMCLIVRSLMGISMDMGDDDKICNVSEV